MITKARVTRIFDAFLMELLMEGIMTRLQKLSPERMREIRKICDQVMPSMR